MDFPEFFSLSKVNDFIKSSRWRGLAVLSSPVNAAQKLDRVDPATGSLCTDRDVALHVLTKPMKCISNVASGVNLVAGKPGVRYFVHSAWIAVRVIAEASTEVYITATIDGVLVRVCSIMVLTGAAGNYNVPFPDLDILGDENTAITTNTTGAAITNSLCGISYCEVGAK